MLAEILIWEKCRYFILKFLLADTSDTAILLCFPVINSGFNPKCTPILPCNVYMGGVPQFGSICVKVKDI